MLSSLVPGGDRFRNPHTVAAVCVCMIPLNRQINMFPSTLIPNRRIKKEQCQLASDPLPYSDTESRGNTALLHQQVI